MPGERQAALVREASVRIARRGLRLLARTWVVLTLVSVAAQLYSTHLLQVSSVATEEKAGMLLALLFANLAYLAIYVVLSLPLTVGALRVTRVPPQTRALGPSLAATLGFGASAVLTLVLLLSNLATDEARTASEATVQSYWVLLALARIVALVGLALALIRLARFAKAPLSSLRGGALMALAAIDSLIPLWRVLSHAPPALQLEHPWLYRALLTSIQLALALLLVQTLSQVRAALAPFEEKEPKAPAEAEPEAEPVAPPAEEPEEPEPAEEEPEPEPPAPSVRDDSAADRHPPEPTSPGRRLAAVILVALSLTVLPLWDASWHHVVAGRHAWPWVLLAVAVVGSLLLYRTLSSRPYAARLVFLLLAGIAGAYTLVSLAEVATARSQSIDAWPVCETATGVDGEYIDLDQLPIHDNVEGPKLETGEACVLAAERRNEHRQRYPHGNLQDGIVQIAIRFPFDRGRFLWGTGLELLALALAGFWVFRAATPEP